MFFKKISDWADKWKRIFNPDLRKQAQEVKFSRKTRKVNNPKFTLNNISVAHTHSQKHLGMYLDEKLNFNKHKHEIIAKEKKGFGINRRFFNILTRNALVTNHKLFVWNHFDYCDILFDQSNNENFCNKIERVQHNAALTITGAIKGTLQIKVYKELGFSSSRWVKCLCSSFRIKINGKSEYFIAFVGSGRHYYNTKNVDLIET